MGPGVVAGSHHNDRHVGSPARGSHTIRVSRDRVPADRGGAGAVAFQGHERPRRVRAPPTRRIGRGCDLCRESGLDGQARRRAGDSAVTTAPFCDFNAPGQRSHPPRPRARFTESRSSTPSGTTRRRRSGVSSSSVRPRPATRQASSTRRSLTSGRRCTLAASPRGQPWDEMKRGCCSAPPELGAWSPRDHI